jgi:hypothetical protein
MRLLVFFGSGPLRGAHRHGHRVGLGKEGDGCRVRWTTRRGGRLLSRELNSWRKLGGKIQWDVLPSRQKRLRGCIRLDDHCFK